MQKLNDQKSKMLYIKNSKMLCIKYVMFYKERFSLKV